uniref:Uncharacterized protein n=1 Tax=Anguilla anguilla TaxID=7936 RepID=A0A0E9SRB0_ANGAN
MYYRFGNKVPVMSMLHDIRYFRSDLPTTFLLTTCGLNLLI